MKISNAYKILEKQLKETENVSPLFGNVAVVNGDILKKAIREMKSAEEVVDIANEINNNLTAWWMLTDGKKMLMDALNRLNNSLSKYEDVMNGIN